MSNQETNQQSKPQESYSSQQQASTEKQRSKRPKMNFCVIYESGSHDPNEKMNYN